MVYMERLVKMTVKIKRRSFLFTLLLLVVVVPHREQPFRFKQLDYMTEALARFAYVLRIESNITVQIADNDGFIIEVV